MTDARRLRLRYPATCAMCGVDLPRGTEAMWDGTAKTASCVAHHEPLDSGQAGASAQAEHDRRKARHEEKVRNAHPRIGGLLLALNGEPQSVKAWETGAKGEVILGRTLDDLAGEHSLLVLHDRRIPSTRANIDHLAVTPAGVFVIDAKNYTGLIDVEVTGGWWGRPRVETLRVDGRDRTALVDGVERQVELVRQALQTAAPDVAVTGMLAFTHASWPWVAKPRQVRSVLLNPRGVSEHLLVLGPLDISRMRLVAEVLAQAFPSATPR